MIKVKLTKSQIEKLAPLRRKELAESGDLLGCGMLVAQVFLFEDGDAGMAVDYIPRDKCDQVQIIMGVNPGKLLSREDVGKIRTYFSRLKT